jgi:hypothetical protein
MAKQLSYLPLLNFGVNGLNTQHNPSTLDPSYLTSADNIVMRESGRISFRKGLKQKVVPTGTAIGSMVEHNDSGTNKIFASHGTSIYTIDFSSPNAAFPASGADVKHTVANSSGDWQFINFNNRLHCLHTGVLPQRYDGSLGSGAKWTAHATDPASISTLFDPSCGMGAYGKLWVGGVTEAPDVVYYSVLLDGDDWTGTGSGNIDLKTVWGTDEIVAIAPFYGQLVIFGKNNIVVYDNPESGGTLALNEVIKGVGCVSRDSVQAIADDLVFLSETGLRSLARTTEKDKLPMQDLSLSIKDTLIRNISNSTNVKSVYLENEGIYIMTFTDKNITYVFDFKHATPQKVPRVTTWSFTNDREPASMINTELYSGLLVGQKDGSIAGYEGYFDIDLAWVSSAASYTNAAITADVSSIWIRMGENISASLLKKMILVLEGGSGATLGLRWYKDFSVNSSSTTQIDLKPATTGYTSLWGASTSLYGTTSVTTTNAGSFVTGTYYAISSAGNTDFTAIGSANNSVGTVFKATGAGSGTGAAVSHTHTASLHSASSKYTPIFGLEEYKTPLTGSAKHLKLNMSIVSNGFNTSIQDLAIISKQGKIR